MIEVKKVIVVPALTMTGVFPVQALVNRGKAGFYVTDRTGVSAAAQADQRFRQDFGGNICKYKSGDKNDTVFGADPAVGYDFYQRYNIPVCTEMEFHGCGAAGSHYTLDAQYSPMGDGGQEGTQNRLSVNILMVNMYYGSKNNSAFTPWVSVGLGYARIHHKATYTDTSWNESDEVSDISVLYYSGYDNNFAWSTGAGVRYDMTPDIALDLSYCYLDIGKSSLFCKDAGGDKYKSETDVKSHDITFGVTYNF